MAKQPTLPLYYNDISRTCSTWTDEEFGCYLRLLIEQWDKGFIPADINRLKRLSTSIETNWPLLKDKFTESNGVLQNLHMEEIREKLKKHSKHQTSNIEKRYAKKELTEDNPITPKPTPEKGLSITVGTQKFTGTLSEWLMLNKESAIEVLMMKAEYRKLKLDDVFKAANSETNQYHFKDTNHPYNYFKSVCDRLIKPVSKFNKPEPTTPRYKTFPDD